MYTYRMALAGALMLLAACSAVPSRPQSATPEVAPVRVVTQKVVPPAAAPVPVMNMHEAATPSAPVASVEVRHMPPPPHAKVKPAPARRPATTAATIPTTAVLNGHVALTGSRDQAVVAGEQADTLVYFVPDSGGKRAKPGHYTVYTHNSDFSPEAMAVPLGSTVTFVNLDDVRHNVFSVTPGAAFDLGYQASGEKVDHAFGRAGVVLVSCNVHRSMELDVLVVPSAYVARVAANGDFTFMGLPAGAGTLHFWNPRAQPVSRRVTLPISTPVSQRIVVVRDRLTTALNVGGKP